MKDQSLKSICEIISLVFVDVSVCERLFGEFLSQNINVFLLFFYSNQIIATSKIKLNCFILFLYTYFELSDQEYFVLLVFQMTVILRILI